ncbi:hypothetical protein K1719_012446 [Acacia pycnantha]|nr:hypothetical protein K1719_012446 [Acacia pycnantha]
MNIRYIPVGVSEYQLGVGMPDKDSNISIRISVAATIWAVEGGEPPTPPSGIKPLLSSSSSSLFQVVLENYGDVEKDSENMQLTRITSWRMVVNEKGQVNVPVEVAVNPGFWSRVCLQNMAKLAKEATTAANTHFLLSILVKHLDHKNVLKDPNMQLDIVDVITRLAKQTKVQQSVAIIGALSDMMRHLRKSIHCSVDDSNLGAEVIRWNQKYRQEVDECLAQLSLKVTICYTLFKDFN